MSNINYLRQLINGSPSTIDLLADGTYLNLYGIKFKSGSNPSVQNLKPLRTGVSGYVESGQIDLVNDTSVSGNVSWNNHTIIDLAPATFSHSPATLGQLDYVSGVQHANLDYVSGVLHNDLDYVSGVLHNNLDYVSGVFHTNLDYVSGVLQSQIDAITSDNAWEYSEVVSSVGGQTIFDVSPKTFNSSNAVHDLQVFRNAGKLYQGVDFTKLDDHRIQTTLTIPQYTRITIRDERTGGTGGGGASVDLTMIDVNIQPDTDGGRSLGGVKAWYDVVLKDHVSGSHYSLSVSGGILICDLVP